MTWWWWSHRLYSHRCCNKLELCLATTIWPLSTYKVYQTPFICIEWMWYLMIGSKWLYCHCHLDLVLYLLNLRTAMKCALKVWMARSAWFLLWFPGGTSSYSMPFSRIFSLNASEASLSSMCFCRPRPAACILLIIFWYAAIICPSVLFFIGSLKI